MKANQVMWGVLAKRNKEYVFSIVIRGLEAHTIHKGKLHSVEGMVGSGLYKVVLDNLESANILSGGFGNSTLNTEQFLVNDANMPLFEIGHGIMAFILGLYTVLIIPVGNRLPSRLKPMVTDEDLVG